MNHQADFIDFFDRLQVRPGCTSRELEQAYHHFAKLYHPDNSETSDLDKFAEVVEAYKALRDPELRKEFEDRYQAEHGGPPSPGAADDKSHGEALEDADAHARILRHLYQQRREAPGNPGIGSWRLEELIGCSPTQFEFHTWYLKAKNLVEVTEMGTLAITIEGIDHVIATSRSEAAKLMITHEAPLTGRDGDTV